MLEDTDISGTYVFRGVEYHVTMSVRDSSMLTIVVEDRLTANRWKGSFDAAYIEDMTHKTGNYKQFHVFVSMMESAIAQSSDSLSMDLLTFNDLELLRKRKAGVATQTLSVNPNPSLTQKRYLILTYTVEFDKIHFPLPLPYAGKPEPELLQEKILELQAQLQSFKHSEHKSIRHRELEQLKHDFDLLMAEKEAVEREYLIFRQEVKQTASGVSAKEIRILKGVVKNLEEEMLKEKAKHQRQSAKRRKEIEKLEQEVRDLKISERNLKSRLKSVTNELAGYKRRALNTSSYSNADTSRRYNTSYRDRSSSRERAGTSMEPRRYTPTNDRYSRPRSAAAGSSSHRHRTPSPHQRSAPVVTPGSGSGQKPRFDPTAYIEEKRQKQLSGSGGRKSASHRSRSSPSGDNSRRYNDSTGRKSRPGYDTSPSYQAYRNSSRDRLAARSNSRDRLRTSSVESLNSLPRSRDPSPRGSRRDLDPSPHTARLGRDPSPRSARLGRDPSPPSARLRRDPSPRSYRGRDPSPRSDYRSRVLPQDISAKSRKTLTERKQPNSSTPATRRIKSRKGYEDGPNKENLPHHGSKKPATRKPHKYDLHNDSNEMDDIDARLQRIQDLMNAGL